MNLRKRFILLIAGVFIIPVLVMGTSFALFNKFMYPSDPQDIARDFTNSLEEAESDEQITELIESLEDAYFGVIMKTSGIIATDMEEKKTRSPKIIIQSKLQNLKDGSQVFVILGVNIIDESGTIFTLLFMLSTLGALSLFSLLIIRSINKSINILEAATGKIADGNLDFKLNTEGTDKLGSLARSLDKMRHQIKMEYDRRNRFFMGVSHDLKTPLSSITGYTDALLEGLSDNKETTEKYLRIIKNKSRELEQRITNLIRYIQLSNYDFKTSLEDKPIAPFLSDFFKQQAEEAGFHGWILNWQVNFHNDLLIPFNEELLGRALENLINNGFQYGHEDKTVSVSSGLQEDHLQILVENNGPVIPEDVLPYIFEPLYRGDNSRKGDGFGLGLASVKSIIESHGWSITAASTEGSTVFKIYISV
jgi:signal transduction histidine kinase